MDFITQYFDETGGLASVPDVARLLDVDPEYVREWARENDLPRVGTAFAFDADDAIALAEEVEENDTDDDDDDDGGNDDDFDDAA